MKINRAHQILVFPIWNQTMEEKNIIFKFWVTPYGNTILNSGVAERTPGGERRELVTNKISYDLSYI